MWAVLEGPGYRQVVQHIMYHVHILTLLSSRHEYIINVIHTFEVKWVRTHHHHGNAADFEILQTLSPATVKPIYYWDSPISLSRKRNPEPRRSRKLID